MKHTLSFALSLFPLLIASVASVPVDSKPRDIISAHLLQRFKYASEYAAAAYCTVNTNNSPKEKLMCAAGNCPNVERANTRTLIEFSGSPSTDTSGFVALDRTNRLIVLSFRGTQSIYNFAAGFMVDLAVSSICPDCTVHTGFLTGWNEVRMKVLQTIHHAATRNPSYQIIGTGHSLGGALAELAVAEIRNTGKPATLYTFGAPRVGNDVFSNYVSRQSGGNFRITNANDGIPKLPPTGMGYTHIWPEFHITSRRNKDLDVRPEDIEVIKQPDFVVGEAAMRSLGLRPRSLGFFPAHYDYLGEITACGTGPIF